MDGSRSAEPLCVTRGVVSDFEDWMRLRGLSESSIKKYEGAISGAMSEWAIDGGAGLWMGLLLLF